MIWQRLLPCTGRRTITLWEALHLLLRQDDPSLRCADF